MYYPRSDTLSDAQHGLIRRLWRVDPFCEFVVCEACMAGHCGAVPGWTGSCWLARWERVWPLYDQLERVGVRIVCPTHYPVRDNLSCLGCGLTYSPAAKRVRGNWRCPSGCHTGVRLPRRRCAVGGS